MKAIITIIDMILTLIIIATIAWFGLKAYSIYTDADRFSTMKTTDKAIMYIVDNDEYNKLQNSHNIVAGILEEFGR